jgi:hypothetical protein
MPIALLIALPISMPIVMLISMPILIPIALPIAIPMLIWIPIAMRIPLRQRWIQPPTENPHPPWGPRAIAPVLPPIAHRLPLRPSP